MAKSYDLKLELDATIGGVPLVLKADAALNPDVETYTLDGSIKDFDIKLSDFVANIGAQFGMDTQLPPELQSLDFKIDYLSGHVVLTRPKAGGTGGNKTHLEVAGKFEIQSQSLNFGWEFFVIADRDSTGGAQPYVLGFALDLDLEFKNLPVVGKIPGMADLKLTKLGFTYTKQVPGKSVSFAIPSVDAGNKIQPNSQSFSIDKKGFTFTVGLENTATKQVVNNFALPMGLPAATPVPGTPPPFFPNKTSPPDSPAHWIDINKTFGPVSLRKIGLNYSKGEATFGFSAGFAVSAFTLDVEGLSITFPLPLPGHEAGSSVSFDLQGLSLDIKKGGLEIGGGFLKVVDEHKLLNYFGTVAVKAGGFGFSAIGGYSPEQTLTTGTPPNTKTVNVPASFFIFANINIPLGGPPFFFVTGVAGGFGINRNLLLPTIEELPYYPLLPHNAASNPDLSGTTPKDAMTKALPALAHYFEDKPGEYWIAVGVQFTTFEMIESFAMVTVAFGVDFQLALLGQCSMTLPPKDNEAPLAYIEIDIMASLNPAIGQFALDGRIAPSSFVFDGLCHISGGFAFYFWFGNSPHKGDFVVTIGGYHPAFAKDQYPHYPKVPRMSIKAQFGPFQIGGEAYFALTPSMLMAGMRVYAVWESGPLKAWFDAGFDFLLGWAPFHYEISAYVHIGISLDLKLFVLSLHLGVDLALWGPDFGGEATIDLTIFTFTIHFGAPHAAPPPVGWDTFAEKFLPDGEAKPQPQPLRRNAMFAREGDAPPPKPIAGKVSAGVADGLVPKNPADPSPEFDWVVDPNRFKISVGSAIPSNQAFLNDGAILNDPSVYGVDGGVPFLQKPEKPFSDTQIWNPTLNIGPMKKKGVQSFLKIWLTKEDCGGNSNDNAFSVQPDLLDVPQSLWGEYVDSTNTDPNPKGGKQLIERALVGFFFSPIPRHPGVVSNVLLESLIFQHNHQTTFFYSAPAVDTGFTVNGNPADDTLDISITPKTPDPALKSPISNQGYKLAALEDSWVRTRRTPVLQALHDEFDTYPDTAVDMKILAAKALTDWPAVGLLGD